MKVYVELPQQLDVAEWRDKHARGIAPDATPYGLHRLADDETVVAFRRPWSSLWGRGLDVLRQRSAGHEVIPAVSAVFSPLRRTADVVVAMDERTGIPAALTAGRVPVVSGIAWLHRPADAWPPVGGIGYWAVRRMAGVFTECPAMVDVLVGGLGLEAGRVHVIRFGVDADYFAPIPYAEAVPGTVFSVGDDRMRDHATLIDAVARVRTRLPRTRLELATTLRVDVPPELGIVHRRRMDSAVRECYGRASVVAVALKPTRVGSGLTVLVEAMASGRPVVVTANPGLEAYVEDGVTGLFVPPGDPDAMAAAVEELLRDPQRAEEMGHAGRRRVEENFTSAHFADDLRAVLRKAVERGR